MKDSRRAEALRTAALACGLAALLPLVRAFSAAPITPKVSWELGREGEAEFDTEANVVTLTGGVRFTYEGQHKAVMTCRQARIELGEEEGEVVRMTASGPVQVEMTTKGRSPKHITAKCQKSATYVGETDTITALGDVVATVQQSSPDAKVRDLSLRGNRMELNVKTGKVTVRGSPDEPAAGSFTLPEEKPEDEEESEKKEPVQ